jgi:hypothetical protein
MKQIIGWAMMALFAAIIAGMMVAKAGGLVAIGVLLFALSMAALFVVGLAWAMGMELRDLF